MCAIVAILHFDHSPERVDRDELLRVRDRMTSRGPDGAGEWYSSDGKVGLGHRRLAIIDLSEAAAQPMLSFDSKLHGPGSLPSALGSSLPAPCSAVITFNGEIYNYRELRALLEGRGYSFRSNSDTEVLLHLYSEHGEQMVKKLRGMYAFAIWDNVKRSLFLARDPYGIKPLYYSEVGQTFRAASQVKALLSSKRLPLDPDPAGHAGFFIWGHVPEPCTLYKHIRSLDPGTTMTVTALGERNSRTFCSIPEIFRTLSQNSIPKRETRSAKLHDLRSSLLDSVKHHLVADVPVGVFLSSGLDSTTLTALASEVHPRIQTITLGFEEFRGTPQDEVPLAEAVAKHYGTDHHTVWITRADFEDHYGHLISEMDQPTTDGVNTYFVSLAARRAGLKVAISGVGGDELFGGYPSFTQIPRITRCLRAPASLPALGRTFRTLTAPLLKRATSPKYASLLEYGGTYGGAYLLRRGMFMPWEISQAPGAENPELRAWSLEHRAEEIVSALNESIQRISTPHARVSALESCWYMRNQLLRDTDWASMAHSLEIRTPLVDINLLQTIAANDSAQPPFTKRDMASTPAKPLPGVVLNRPKTGFTIPVRDWLRQSSLHRSSAFSPQPSAFADRGLRGWAKQIYASFTDSTVPHR